MGTRCSVVPWDLLSDQWVAGRPLIGAQVYEQTMQLFERTEQNYRRTQLYSRARHRVQHPLWEDRACAIGHRQMATSSPRRCSRYAIWMVVPKAGCHG